MPEPPGTRAHETVLPPTPIIYEHEEEEPKAIPLRVHAAILLRVPESGIDWLDKMILRSRELDREEARLATRNVKRPPDRPAKRG